MSQFNKIKMIFTAGSKLNLDILKSLQSKLSATITEIYGSSRTDENPDGVVNLGKDKISNTTKLMQLYINSLQKKSYRKSAIMV
ncbi:hypothetical protein [uncultured Campylobacter sp.]|uniref:hypothetical protein n=1 Tax=uncultured Campylobacter sp. TaxID=218934 RepID=UPI0025F84C0A|nr:hypothetical protein [uncultured Campylobacter sp.]